MFTQKDKFRHMGVMKVRDGDAYNDCMEVLDSAEWDKEISRVNRFESYAIDLYVET